MTENQLYVLLSDLRALPNETEWLEFKVNNGQKLGEYISALSNSACILGISYGYIVFGIDDKSHRVVGTNFDLHNKIKGNEEMIPYISRMLEPRINFDCFEIIVEGLRVIIIRINATINTPVKYCGISHIRIGSIKTKLDNYPEKQRIIWTKKPTSSFENEICRSNLSEKEVLHLLDYTSYFKLINKPLLVNKNEIVNVLIQENIINKSFGEYDITNIGAILFGTNLSEFEALKRKSIRVIVYDGKNKIKTKKEQLGQKGYAVGFEGLVEYVNNQLPMREEIINGFREEIRVFPKIAVRELIANTLIHQDFLITGSGPMIEIFEDRIEFTNPGTPLIDTSRFIDHNPQSRNEKLASFMRRMNICEERGSGIDKVVFACERFQLPAPKFIKGDNYTTTVLYAYKTLRQMDLNDKIRACYHHTVIKYISNEKMTNRSLRERFGIPEKNYSIVSRIIAEGIKSHLIKPFNPDNRSNKNSSYIPYWA